MNVINLSDLILESSAPCAVTSNRIDSISLIYSKLDPFDKNKR